MKQLLLFILCPFFLIAQTQIGQNILGDSPGDQLGSSVSISSNGNVIAIGAPWNDSNGPSSGHVRIYENQSGTWVQIGQDIEGEAQADLSGWSVSLSSNGTIVAISSIQNDGNGSNSGHVRIYENQSGTWVQIGQDIEGEATGDQTGSSLSLSSNGAIVAIGATFNSGNGSFSGHVRIYENQNGTWVQIGQDIDGEASNDRFGTSLSLSSNGDIVAIGAPFNDGNGTDSGHARVYENQNGTWVQIGQDIDSESAGDRFGTSLSLSSNGNIIAIGADRNDGNGDISGHVRVYENQNGSWVQIGQDIDGEATIDQSGYSVSISSNGSIVAIGAPFNDDNGDNSGHVRIYKNQNDSWVQIGNDIDGESANDRSGESLSLSSNGSTVVIGSINANGSGHVRVYDISGLLSIQEFSDTNFSLYPNPVQDQLAIILNDSVQLEKVRLYNTLGQVVITSTKNSIDTSKLTSGTYIVEVTTNQGTTSKQLIKE